VHLIRRLCDRFGIELADEVLQETLAKEVRSLCRSDVSEPPLTPPLRAERRRHADRGRLTPS
jgi:hypothetical protein